MIDLHTHTNFSDGTDTPAQLINKALAEGISVLAITDHDTTSGWTSAQQALRADLSLVLGAEISCLTSDGVSVHMLGLLFDGEHKGMQTMLENTRDGRIPRAHKMIELLNAGGIEISMADVESVKPLGATLGRPHIADALVKNGVVASRDEAFTNLLHNNSPYYVAHLAPTPEDAISIIRSAGGVAVIAHPFASHRGAVLSVDDFLPLKNAGLSAIEVNHRDHSNEERNSLAHIARELDLVITGASDYHGTGKLNSLGENHTNQAEWERLESHANQRRVIRV
ncbi:MAG: PHP domain-containing protein [Candidatus Planktophila sp.]